MDCSQQGSSVHGISQAGILEWVTIPFSRGSSTPQGLNPSFLCLLHWQAGSLPTCHLGSHHPTLVGMSLSKTTWAPPVPALVIHTYSHLPRFQYQAGAARGQVPSTPSPRPSHCPGPVSGPGHVCLSMQPYPWAPIQPCRVGLWEVMWVKTPQPRGWTRAPVHTICLWCQGVLLPSRHTLCRSPGFSGLFSLPWHPTPHPHHLGIPGPAAPSAQLGDSAGSLMSSYPCTTSCLLGSLSFMT